MKFFQVNKFLSRLYICARPICTNVWLSIQMFFYNTRGMSTTTSIVSPKNQSKKDQ